MTIKALQKLPKGTDTNYGKFAGLEQREVDGEKRTVATFTEPKIGANTGNPITATVMLSKISIG